MKRVCLGFIVLSVLFACKHQAQPLPTVVKDTIVAEVKEYPFEQQIQKYEENDKIKTPPQGAILFIGSSSFRMWNTLTEDMKGLTVMNRAFGGAITANILHYMPRIVYPYHPKKIVYYCGDNDVASGVKFDSVLAHYKEFIKRVKDSLPETKIYFVSNKPSLTRKKLLQQQKDLNEALKNICAQYEKVEYIDIFPSMMVNDTTIRNDIFKTDSLHMNEKGYAIWTKIIKKRIAK